MTDIVQRLREDCPQFHETLMKQVADVIEQLRSDLALRDQTARDRKEIIAKLETEIERLRALKTPASSQLLNITKACLDNAEDEIEHLRADKDVRRSQERNTSYEASITELESEIERLRTQGELLREVITKMNDEIERLRADKAELLAALNLVEKCGDVPDAPVIERVRAAIAKAEGR